MQGEIRKGTKDIPSLVPYFYIKENGFLCLYIIFVMLDQMIKRRITHGCKNILPGNGILGK